MIADTRTAWRRNLASIGSPKISSNTPWKNTTKTKKVAAETTEGRARLFWSDILRNLRMPAMEGKRRVSDIVNPLVLTLRDRDIPSNPIVVRLLLSQTMPLPSTDQLHLNTSAGFLPIGEPMDAWRELECIAPANLVRTETLTIDTPHH